MPGYEVIGKEEQKALNKLFNDNRTKLGKIPIFRPGLYINKFEKKFAKYIGTKYAVAVNSGTAALHLSILCNNFPPKKKILVPAITFSATAASALYCGLIPKFVDIKEQDLTIDFEDLKKKYTKDCVALICVHMGGHPAQMEKIRPWAKKKNLLLIEDSAESCGAIYKGKVLGTWGDIGCYSFEEKKLMTTGDGGMMVTDQPELFKDVKAMRWVGIDKDNWKTAQAYTDANKDALHWFYELNVLGYKYNMNDLAAAIGLAQLEKI